MIFWFIVVWLLLSSLLLLDHLDAWLRHAHALWRLHRAEIAMRHLAWRFWNAGLYQPGNRLWAEADAFRRDPRPGRIARVRMEMEAQRDAWIRQINGNP